MENEEVVVESLGLCGGKPWAVNWAWFDELLNDEEGRPFESAPVRQAYMDSMFGENPLESCYGNECDMKRLRSS